jgi:hypothetical protein
MVVTAADGVYDAHSLEIELTAVKTNSGICAPNPLLGALSSLCNIRRTGDSNAIFQRRGREGGAKMAFECPILFSARIITDYILLKF